MLKIGIIIGSPRQSSYSAKIAEAILTMLKDQVQWTYLPIIHLPFFNTNSESEENEDIIEFRQKITQLDGLIFITPEYNRSVPAVLKNALEIGSFPYLNPPLSGKTALIISQSSGALGGMAANHHLRQILSSINVISMAHPEIYLSNVKALFDAEDKMDGKTYEFLEASIQQFLGFSQALKQSQQNVEEK